MKKSNLKLKAVEEPKPLLKLDLGAGQVPREGFKGVDAYSAADFKVDLFKFPWPWKDSAVEEVVSSHFFEHVPHLIRGKFMDEVFRILIPGGKASFIVPFGFSVRATQDFTHEWPPLTPTSFIYFNKKWREDNKLTHGYYDLKADFDFTYGFAMSQAWAARNDEARGFAMQHYNNVADDLHVTLVSKKEAK